jgi:hypothetical protein
MNHIIRNPPSSAVNVTLRDTSGNALYPSILKGAPTDGSSSIVSGGTSQQVFAANTGRTWLLVQNVSAAVLYINFGAAATADSNSIKLNPNATYENPSQFCPNGIITIIGGTTGQKFIAKEA